MNSHALMLEYGNTHSEGHPVVLMVLREPNTKDTICDGKLGMYDFKEFPRCAAWNTAYGLIGRRIGLDARTFKHKCEEAGTSPILFTDASTAGIQNMVADKYSRRRNTGIQAEQGDRIFSLLEKHDLLKRVRLILLSGLKNDVFQPIVERLHFLAAEKEIPMVDIPFMYGTNILEINAKLELFGDQILTEIGQEFMNGRRL